MSGSTFASSYQGYAIFICLVTGFLLLRLDAAAYASAGQKKEQRTARALGWFNLALGGAAFVAKIIISL